MKAKAMSLFFEGRNDREVEEYNRQLDRLKEMYADEVCFMESVCIGSKISSEADIVIIPQLFGAVFKESERLKAIQKPIMILTSEFGTVEMWDWEIVAWLRDELKMNIFSRTTARLQE